MIIVSKVCHILVTELFEKFVVLNRTVCVEHEAVDCAVGYPRTHHAEHSSPSGTEYLRGDTNLHGVAIRNESLSGRQSYQGRGVDVSEGDVHLEEVNIELVISEQEDSRGNSLCLSPDGVHSVQHQI